MAKSKQDKAMLINFAKSRQYKQTWNTDNITAVWPMDNTFDGDPEYVIWLLMGTPSVQEGNIVSWAGDGFVEIVFPEKKDRDNAYEQLKTIMGYIEIS